ncbi:MAG: hypothetical protein GOU97_00440 [Nanoarchaeota archaeon]|nr:hypothetical protein [Nanoarchaeota archaeon]
MVFTNVRDSLVSEANKRKAGVASKDFLRKELKKLFKMGAGFYSEKNYSNSFYCYYSAIKKMAVYYVQSVLGQQGIPESDALEFLVKNKKFGLDKSKTKFFERVVNELFHLGKADSKECSSIKKLALNMKKKVL